MPSKYLPLTNLLKLQPPKAVCLKLKFAHIEKIIGSKLPSSARQYRPWWGNENDPNRSQARSWMDVGWHVESIDLNREDVVFSK